MANGRRQASPDDVGPFCGPERGSPLAAQADARGGLGQSDAALSAAAGADSPQGQKGQRHRPLVPVLAGMALGIALDAALSPPVWALAVLGLVAVVLALLSLRRTSAGPKCWAFAFVLLVPFGGFWHAVRFRQKPAWHLKNLPLDGRALYRITGRVSRAPRLGHRHSAFLPEDSFGSGYWSVRVEVDGLSGGSGGWHRTAGGMDVFVNAGWPDVDVGDTVEFLARPWQNRPPANPGEPDLRLAAQRAGSYATASVESAAALVVTERSSWWHTVPVAVGRLRCAVWERLEGQMGCMRAGERFGLVAALLLGERSALTTPQERLLKESGTLHFLAISGLHVGLFALFLGCILTLLPLPVRARAVSLIVMVWVYVLFTGCSVSAARAGWMLSFMLAAPLLERQRDSLSAVAGAALFILVAWPQELFAPGFQLTFVAVWAIICVYPQLTGMLWPWEDLLARLEQPEERGIWQDLWVSVRSYALLSVVVWAATAPILAYHFNSVSLWAPLLNLFMWPLVLLLLIACFVLTVCLPFGYSAAWPAAWAAGFLAEHIEALLRVSSGLPGSGLYTPQPALWWVVLFCVVVAGWTVRTRLGLGRRAFAAAAALLALALVAREAGARAKRAFSLTIADVGTGQAALVQTPEGEAILFDAGSVRQGAEQAVAGLLWHRRANPIGAVVLSHFDRDHCNFIPYLTDRFRIGQAVVPASGKLAPLATLARGWLRQEGLDVRPVTEGAELAGGRLRCVVLHPNMRFATELELPENEKCLVLHGTYNGLTFLLPGDIQTNAIRRLNHDYGDRLRADILLVPHHGHYSEGLEEFVGHVRPAVAVVSGAEAQCDLRTRQILDASGAPLWSTEVEGAVIVTLRGHVAGVVGYASGRSFEFESGQSAKYDFGGGAQ